MLLIGTHLLSSWIGMHCKYRMFPQVRRGCGCLVPDLLEILQVAGLPLQRASHLSDSLGRPHPLESLGCVLSLELEFIRVVFLVHE